MSFSVFCLATCSNQAPTPWSPSRHRHLRVYTSTPDRDVLVCSGNAKSTPPTTQIHHFRLSQRQLRHPLLHRVLGGFRGSRMTGGESQKEVSSCRLSLGRIIGYWKLDIFVLLSFRSDDAAWSPEPMHHSPNYHYSNSQRNDIHVLFCKPWRMRHDTSQSRMYRDIVWRRVWATSTESPSFLVL